MKKILIFTVLFLSLFAILIQAQESKDVNISTYYFIRHAEKMSSNDRDPKLNKEGILRAEKWANVFKNISFDAVYSTNYKRTKSTANPTAKSQDLEITLYNPRGTDYAQFLKDTIGKTVLVVGHSNTIPDFVNKIINKDKYKLIEHNNNGNLYIVEFINSSFSHKLLHIN